MPEAVQQFHLGAQESGLALGSPSTLSLRPVGETAARGRVLVL